MGGRQETTTTTTTTATQSDNDNQININDSSDAPTTTTTPTNDVNNYPQWHNSIAGAAAGAGARFATAPLDLIRIRRQLQTTVTYPRPSLFSSMVKVVKSEGGVIALFQGTLAATYLWIGYSAVQFTLYARTKEFILTSCDQDNQHSTAVAFVSGAVAGSLATISTYPFDFCRTVFAARGIHQHSLREPGDVLPPRSLNEFALSYYRQRGLIAFYAGCGPAVIQIIPYMGLSFAIYDTLTKGDRRVSNSGMAGSIAGAVSKMIVYPMDTVKKRLQAQAVYGTSVLPYKGVIDCIARMLRDEGVASFYQGLVPSVLKTTIATGLSFGIFRFTKNILESIHDDYHNANSGDTTVNDSTTTTAS